MPRKSKRSTRAAKKRDEREQHFLEKIHLDAAGIDVGSQSHWVAVPQDRNEQPVREFRSFTHDLHAMADWLTSCAITTVAMESTGVYWVPLYEILEERGFEVILVNALHVKNVPGRKTDVLDCQWIQQLHTFGLLRGSFRPSAEIASMRTLVRHRDQLVTGTASYIQRMQKALTLMNLQLHNVISDITGATGLAILREIVAGQTDPEKLARHRDYRCKASEAEIAASLTGHYREEHVFVLRQELALYDFYREQISLCDARIEAGMRDLEAHFEVQKCTDMKPPRRQARKKKSDPDFDLHSPLLRLCGGVDLTEIPGMAPYNSLKLISEIGLDMSRWPTAKHFVSWLTLSANNKISGGKLLSSKTQPSANRAAKIFRVAAMSIGRSGHALGAFYRRLAARIGKAKAITATARKIAILVYRSLRDGLIYSEQTASEYDQTQTKRRIRALRKRAASLGFQIVDETTGLVME